MICDGKTNRCIGNIWKDVSSNTECPPPSRLHEISKLVVFSFIQKQYQSLCSRGFVILQSQELGEHSSTGSSVSRTRILRATEKTSFDGPGSSLNVNCCP